MSSLGREPGTTFHSGINTSDEWFWLHRESAGNRYCATAISVLMLIIYERVEHGLPSGNRLGDT